ncbi:RNA/RNP complex-1-interacting phosphatase isoform X2 [Plodia interpunctella]|uniref:RNA/RNP complex-1-interacting phosphatase isoform X2 n=1 Tax=Plodia interpunctella TaxID=58824 RepID=UPI0023682A6D|nr:RNA/RNP complex-1-interacting phosphatase isoform X2 [Plodia interpunctella]
MPPSIPDRWIPYKACGNVIDGTRIICFKVPLRKELQAAGVLHKKILMPGRIIPPEDKVQEFMDTVDEFLGKNRDFLVGVHCTHGLNRTGYMVCRYMRDRLHIPAKTVIKRFEIARGYQIERDNYIADLLGKSPPEPDLGKDTIIKPQNDRKNSMSYQSPLGEYDYGETSNSRYESRYRRSRKGRGDERHDPYRRDSGGSYDYKYDY